MKTNDRYKSIVSDYKKRTVLLIKCTVLPMALVMLVLAITLLVDIIGVKTIVLEAGDELPSAAEVSGKKDAEYLYDEESIDLSKVGVYEIKIVYGEQNEMKLKIKVKDTTAPKGAVKALYLHNGASVRPDAKDYFENITDASEYTAQFIKEPAVGGLGEYSVEIALEDEYGNKSKYKTKLCVINDTEDPKIYPPTSVVGYKGEGIAYLKDVTFTDNCFGAKIEVDASAVDSEKAGTYQVTYIVTDAAGNKISAIIPVYIHETKVTAQELSALIEKIAQEEGMSKSLSKEELCKKIYEYINDPTAPNGQEARFVYAGNSNDPSRSDWRYEAKKTLENGQGDCYSYFALSKAFFEYFGIENMDIERTKGLTSDTHFWNMVNIGSESSPRWYFFDATRYAGKFNLGGNNGCLLTQAQLDSYTPKSSGYGKNYYAFDASSYPSVETAIINQNYSWR